MAYTDDQLLKLVGAERGRSIGFGEGDSGELTNARETALAYYKGDMINVPAEHKVPSLPGRSKAVDTTLADAIETVLPDVMEIFVGGDDVATFQPQDQADEDAAKNESDFVTNVIMVQNEGFLNLYTAFKDALLTRTGIWYVWWEDNQKQVTQHTVPAAEADEAPILTAIAGQLGHELEPETQEDGSVDLKQTMLYGNVCYRALPPEDFTVAPDTVSLRDATYCAMRDRPRVQDLIVRGIDAKKARALPSYSTRDDTVERARDEAGEHNQPMDGGDDDLRIVETRAHYIRLLADDNTLSLWRVVTNADETVLLEREELGATRPPFASLTPYIVPHRYYGESVGDKLIEVQKIKTALLRMHLDSGYFALNQRNEVVESGMGENTIADLLRNEPGVPVRVKTPGTINPISAGSLNFDTLASLEYASTMAEARSGIVRNAQGLNPDTLHETAAGAMALIGAAQKRVRMIARIFAETGAKDLWLIVHAMLRANFTDEHAPPSAKIRNKWQTAKPNAWPERTAMDVHIGIGSAGKEHDFAIANQRLTLMNQLVALQGGAQGPFVGPNNVHAALETWERAAGSKTADSYWADPSDPNAPKPPPKQDPAMAEIQGKLQIEQAKVQAKQQADATSAQSDLQLQQAKHQAQMVQDSQQAAATLQLEREKAQMAHDERMHQISQEIMLRREIAAQELALNREVAMEKLAIGQAPHLAQVDTGVQQVSVGGAPG